jgi:hypothetical protein
MITGNIEYKMKHIFHNIKENMISQELLEDIYYNF